MLVILSAENFIFYRQIKGDENLLLSKDYDSSSMGRLSCIDVATIFAGQRKNGEATYWKKAKSDRLLIRSLGSLRFFRSDK